MPRGLPGREQMIWKGVYEMERIKKNFGFGFMRLPLLENGEVNLTETTKMVDAFLEAGFNYFDTAHGYLDGRSETALKACLTSRYPREDYVLTNKLTANFFKTEADIRPFFESQLAACGVDDFDFYLMHAQSMKNFEHFKVCRAYETAFALKAEGKVRHVGISFHDSAEMLDRILTEYPQLEAVQYRQAVQGMRLLLRKISCTLLTAASSVSSSGLKSRMKAILSSTCRRSLMPESTILMPGKPAAKRMA